MMLASLHSKVHEVPGRGVATLVDEHLVAGNCTAKFYATEPTSVTHIYQ